MQLIRDDTITFCPHVTKVIAKAEPHMEIKYWSGVRGLAAAVIVMSAAIPLAGVIIPALATKLAQDAQQMTMTSMTGMMSSSQMMTTMTNTVVAPIAGFPAESILVGFVLAMSLLVLFRRRRRDQRPSI